MKLVQFGPKKKEASIGDLDTILYKVYNDGSFETMTLPHGKAGLNRIPYMDANVALVRMEIPQIRGYAFREMERSRDDRVVTLVYSANGGGYR